MIKQMMDFQKEMEEKDALFEKTLITMKESMEKEIKMLKESNAI